MIFDVRRCSSLFATCVCFYCGPLLFSVVVGCCVLLLCGGVGCCVLLFVACRALLAFVWH